LIQQTQPRPISYTKLHARFANTLSRTLSNRARRGVLWLISVIPEQNPTSFCIVSSSSSKADKKAVL